jgi:O-antigen ligase
MSIFRQSYRWGLAPKRNHIFTFGFCVFLLVCLQATLLKPYIILVPGERTNLFTTVLTLVPLLLLGRDLFREETFRFLLPWMALGIGMAALTWGNPEPESSLIRIIAFWAPTVAGLFCARALLHTPARLKVFFIFLAFCFAALTALNLIMGRPPEFLGLHHHALTGALVLLSAGPLYLLLTGSGWTRLVPAVLLCLGYLLCFLAGSRFLVLLPFLLIPIVTVALRVRIRGALIGFFGALVLALVFFTLNPGKIPSYSNYESTFYRMEGVPASWEIIKQHPLTGIGIYSPRTQYLKDFRPYFGMVSRDVYLAVVQRNVTPDNIYVSLAVGIGVPLALAYFVLLSRLLWRFATRMAMGEINHAAGNAILFPVLATLIHLAIYDGLFYPQICWFFHLLVGIGAWCGAKEIEAVDAD